MWSLSYKGINAAKVGWTKLFSKLIQIISIRRSGVMKLLTNSVTMDETSETTSRSLYCLFPNILYSTQH